MNRAIDYYLNGPPMWVAESRWRGTSLLDGAMWWDGYLKEREAEAHTKDPRLCGRNCPCRARRSPMPHHRRKHKKKHRVWGAGKVDKTDKKEKKPLPKDRRKEDA